MRHSGTEVCLINSGFSARRLAHTGATAWGHGTAGGQVARRLALASCAWQPCSACPSSLPSCWLAPRPPQKKSPARAKSSAPAKNPSRAKSHARAKSSAPAESPARPANPSPPLSRPLRSNQPPLWSPPLRSSPPPSRPRLRSPLLPRPRRRTPSRPLDQPPRSSPLRTPVPPIRCLQIRCRRIPSAQPNPSRLRSRQSSTRAHPPRRPRRPTRRRPSPALHRVKSSPNPSRPRPASKPVTGSPATPAGHSSSASSAWS